MRHANNATSQQLVVADQTIPYSLIFASRKSVGITIRPDMSVDVRAPQGISLNAVAEIVRQRAPWILRHLQKFAQRPAKQLPDNKKKGESYQFLGRHLPLKIVPLARNTREQVNLDKDGLSVWVKEPQDALRVNALLAKWSREQAEIVFTRRMLMHFPRFKDLPVHLPDLSIRNMKARWGSCSTKGTITLNLKLIHLEEALIDYVIMHELCHLIEHNHSKHYYSLLSRMMPDWKNRRQQLNELGMPD